ncbi:MAG TPA: hypothetical protein VM099_09170 [Gemmatimonadaceae bacterium]|nr:hypothetical protein [Gemmatimonadaceae bacterium]
MNAHDDLIPIAELFYDDAGPHILRIGSGGEPRYTPARGQDLHALIGATIAQLGGVAGGTRKTPTHLTPPVPIESLLYKGRAALDRALEIRAARAAGHALEPEIVDELLDLVALAVQE